MQEMESEKLYIYENKYMKLWRETRKSKPINGQKIDR